MMNKKPSCDFMLGEISERTKDTKDMVTLLNTKVDRLEGNNTATKESIKWLKWGVRGLYGSGLLGLVVWIVRGVLG